MEAAPLLLIARLFVGLISYALHTGTNWATIAVFACLFRDVWIPAKAVRQSKHRLMREIVNET